MKMLDISGAEWIKSSYSGGNEGECVEVARNFASRASWRKSSYSGGNEGQCVEVADNITGFVPVRDSKNPGRTPLIFPALSWTDFLRTLRNG
ncbi:DUF397 domain-containing protein [Streptomyces olivoreticuli]|uniref:DUF397 domain-containing protein n=1 Tax=Streptomyces olivoreticuli TaxID=68246 RepID=UPI0026589A8B|nr:DUF397 domain-containing protein [Streptomyces olivoreticuli]WKK25056.1 DUF397 domain-containing protein [Streptomyces olivoreticuli]